MTPFCLEGDCVVHGEIAWYKCRAAPKRARCHVACAGTLASAGQIRVNQSLAGAPEAFRNATINLNRPAARQGPSYVFAAGSQVCIPNFFGLGPAAPAAAAPQPAAAQGEHTPLRALTCFF